VVTPPGTTATTNTGSALPYFQQNPDVAASYLVNNYGMTPEQFAAAHYSQYGRNEQRTAPAPAITPFANATQGFDQNFRNYTSIPIGSQYNPNVVGGTGSPYSQIMGQMRPLGNPYANVAAGQAMGGYDPNLYNRIAQANAVARLAAGTGVTLADYYGGGDGPSGPGAPGPGGDNADGSPDGGGNAGIGGDGSPDGGGNSGNRAMGGLITRVFGPDPAGPDEGQVNMMRGEYVIRKSSVNKYGTGLLDMINEGKVPAKKMKSLLG
jgi:hypothetical protein